MTMNNVNHPLPLLTNGQLLATEQQLSVINPFDESVTGKCSIASAELLDETVDAARAAFASWRKTPWEDRRERVMQLADLIDANISELADIITREQGKPIERATEEAAFAAIYARYFAGLELEPELVSEGDGVKVELFREPIGVVAGICPWNFPLLIAVYKLAPAILAGNTVIIKPAPTTPLSILKLGQLAKDVFPAGVLNILADDNALGPLISEHPGIDKISFTGSTPVGRNIMASAACNLKRLTLELGGNDPGVVLDDADPSAIAEAIFNAAFFNSGQVCIALKRLYVHRTIYEPMCAELAQLANGVSTGDGMAAGIDFGPVQNRKQFEHLKQLLQQATDEGAQVLAGGETNDQGFCFSPCIVAQLDRDSGLVQNEQFGPILPVVAYDDLDELIEHINSGPFGLGASVWSGSTERVRDIAMQIDSGTVWINQHLNFGPHIPLPAAKQSGNGVEWGREGLLEYTRPRVVNTAV